MIIGVMLMMVKAMQNKKSGIPCPCKKDCADRCDGCRLECKKFGIYEKLKRYEEKKKKNELKYKKYNTYNIRVSRKEMYADWALESRRNRKVMFEYV